MVINRSVLNRTVITLGLVSFFADISSEMLYPITPIFLTSVLGASMISVGLIEGLAECISSLLKTFSGVWSDKISKRKPFVIVGYLLAAVAKPLTGSSSSWSQVLVARSLDRTGKGLRSSPRDALLAESVTKENSGAAFGLHRGMDTLGAAVGPLLALIYLSHHANDLREIYYWALIPGLCAVALIFLIPEKPKAQPLEQSARQQISLKNIPFEFKKYVFAWGLFSLTNSSDIFILMKAKVAGISLSKMILMYCFYNLIYSLLSPSLGHLSDSLGRKKILISGLLIFAFVYTGFAFAREEWMFWVLFLTYGIYMAATDSVGKALALDLMPVEMKATALGILGTVSGVSTLFASIMAGLLWEKINPASALLYGVFGAVMGATIITSLKARSPQQ